MERFINGNYFKVLKMGTKLVFFIAVAFILGILSNVVYSYYYPVQNNFPVTTTTYVIANEKTIQQEGSFITQILGLNNEEKASPYDRIPENKIFVEDDKVIINIANAQWSRFTDTNSMDPVIDQGANAIQIIPKSPDEIYVGDIVSYESEYADGIIIHRVIEIGYDDDGWYALMKGDNNSRVDPGKVRFSQIQRVVIAIIY